MRLFAMILLIRTIGMLIFLTISNSSTSGDIHVAFFNDIRLDQVVRGGDGGGRTPMCLADADSGRNRRTSLKKKMGGIGRKFKSAVPYRQDEFNPM